jgi:hypothetical protein
MATGSRTLKLSILADVDQLNKSLKAANNDVESSSSKISDFGKKAGLAFAAAAAAAGAYAIKIGIDGVKAAIADEAAQVKLAGALRNATGATDDQIAAVEKQILKMSLATGVSDDQLRPAMARLSLSTQNAGKAQELLALALDVSTQTGRPLEGVANALGKAYDGNTAALGKLGIGLSSAELKAMSFEQVQGRLSDLFAGAATANANTFAGRMERLKVTFDEAKETIGFALLPILEKLMNFMTLHVIPIVEKVSNAFSNKSGGLTGYIEYLGAVITNVFTPIWSGLVKAFGYIKDAIGENMDSFLAFGKLIADYVAPVIGTVLGKALQGVGIIAGGVIDIVGNIVGVITKAIQGAISAINWLLEKYNSIPLLPNVPLIPVSSAPTVSVPKSSSSGSSSAVPSIPSVPTITPPGASASESASKSVAATGAAITSMTATLVPTVTIGGAPAGYKQETFTPTVTIGGAPAGYVSNAVAPQVTVNMGVVGDPEAAARTITTVLNNSYYRGTGGAGALVG